MSKGVLLQEPVRKLARPAPYQSARVRAVFDALADTYDWAPWLAGGLLGRWRRQLARHLPLPGSGRVHVVDLMAGGAELWPALRGRFGDALHVTAVDFSAPMLARAAGHGAGPRLHVTCANVLATPLSAGQATAVTCAFGLKTLAPTDYPALAQEAARLLRQGGAVALVEFEPPRPGWRRRALLGYIGGFVALLRWLLPRAGAHTHLVRYAGLGPDWPALRQALRQAGFQELRQRRLWPGLAVLLTARVPHTPSSLPAYD